MFNQTEAVPSVSPHLAGSAVRINPTDQRSKQRSTSLAPAGFVPLDQEARTAIPTPIACVHIDRKPSCLYEWSSKGNGPIKPVKVNGRLLWLVADIRRLLTQGQ